ncbi:alpha-1,2-fucosyltransferase [Ramlibacter alkalitolerans]|jgi:hypothetical protein|uniref:Alpha-1,2-fucosyltransferase n=1 Tax=Ramlibacter alkalitolerans TaxID=2039631 RepID=A0ABS1JJ58_9BURK|nr:alpha-1,2-fucosyltransferase [Ramlibacter alkalitolerans]MBL0423840.1 alpha-1,2-fucosyltransferase [Ramlibacter alkalitolerans]
MIVSRLIGGLGNQMFQYAAGRALALRRGAPLRIDRRAFAEYKTHAFGLDSFRAELVDAPADQLPGAVNESRLNRLLRPFMRTPLRLVTERAFTFDPEIASLPDGVYLDGYWQSEKYFAHCAEAIRQDFTVRHAPSAENARWLERIAATPSVSLHVRRGDYVTNPSANAVHGTCDLGYYRRAVEHVRQALGTEPVLFVFSDDPDWVAANLRLGCEMHLVRNNDAATNYEDLRLMSACRHHVIANSSFSWWGAWLDARPGAITVAPQRWFAAGTPDARDLVPERWVRL